MKKGYKHKAVEVTAKSCKHCGAIISITLSDILMGNNAIPKRVNTVSRKEGLCEECFLNK